jgi:CRISPR-associated RAMP protein (TIGR02581 family)
MALTLTLESNGPVLIKSGHEAGCDPTLVDMNFVRTSHPKKRTPTVFIPGSSLKGTLRSYTERVLRTVLGEGEGRCCDPFDYDEKSKTRFCGKKLENDTDTAKRYRDSCPACRIFGNTALGGRLAVMDAYPPDDKDKIKLTNDTEVRDGVAIDRLVGGVANGPFSMEIVTRGVFKTTLILENFELWQVGLLAIALRDLGTGLCPIGFGKTRGFGLLKVEFEQLEVAYPGRFDPQADGRHYGEMLYSVAEFHPEWISKEMSYGLRVESAVALGQFKPAISENGDLGRVAFQIEGDAVIRRALTEAAKSWKVFALAKKEQDHG